MIILWMIWPKGFSELDNVGDDDFFKARATL